MAKKAEFTNLFDMASDKGKKKEKQGVVPPGAPEKAKVPIVENLDEAFAKYKQMHHDLQDSIERAFEKAKISPQQVEEYMANPTHFSDESWKTICKTKKELDDKLSQLVRRREKKKKGQVKIKKKKKGFATRKEWLQMG